MEARINKGLQQLSRAVRPFLRGLLNFVIIGLLVTFDAQGWAASSPSLLEAARQNDIAQVRELLSQSAEVNAADELGITALHVAAINDNVRLAEALLSKGANVHARTNNGMTPLHFAASQGSLDLAKVLLAYRADIDATDNLGRLPLKLGIIQNHQSLANWLRTKGAHLARDWDIRIGTKKYRLSAEAQEYLTILEQGDYETRLSVLIIEEPHFSAKSQWNLYRGLEQFFSDHPQLASRTIFLAEGVEAGKPVSIESLKQAEKSPDPSLVRTVLRSFLIPAYVAYAWAYHQPPIPIVGTEDKQLYETSAALWPAENNLLWQLSVVARNKSLAKTLIERTEQYENPILFTGSLHLASIAPTTHEVAKELITSKILTSEQLQRLRASDNVGVTDYLRQAKIGYTFIRATGYEPPEIVERHRARYHELFQAQRDGRYLEYIQKILPQLRHEPGVTVNPAPEAAAQLIHALTNNSSSQQNDSGGATGSNTGNTRADGGDDDNSSKDSDNNSGDRKAGGSNNRESWPGWLKDLHTRLRNLREMDRRHTSAVRAEQKGKTISGRDGKPQDHQTEVSNLREGLQRLMKNIKGALSDPKLTQDQVQTLTEMLGEVSKRLDAADGALGK